MKCEHCGELIKARKELIVGYYYALHWKWFGPRIFLYHKKCHDKIKDPNFVLITSTPEQFLARKNEIKFNRYIWPGSLAFAFLVVSIIVLFINKAQPVIYFLLFLLFLIAMFREYRDLKRFTSIIKEVEKLPN